MAALGGFRTQGASAQSAVQLVRDALALEEAGCFAVVLECVPQEVAARITGELAVPTIGIGAGADCDGQVLVFHDAMGLYPGQPLRFVKRFANLHPVMLEAAKAYVAEVHEGSFPAPRHCVSMPEEEREEFTRLYGSRPPRDDTI
jgi:3-methyl-2-oxobutanoate hydroxymethyltransferase